jgi:phage shock protein PspC (stress-responsive transcriptional regulator)
VADRLYRSRDDRMLAGVAGGLARVMDADPSIIRVVWVLVTILSGGIGLLVYIVMAIVVPEAPDGWDPQRMSDPGVGAPRGPVAPGGWVGPDGKVVPFAGTHPGSVAPTATAGATPDGWHPPRHSGDGRRAGAIIGLILILLGGAFLVREFMPAVDLSAVWPVLSIGFGVVLLVLAVRPRRSSD